jgi:hypothetical protein
MARLPVIAAAVIAIAASTSVITATTTPASAQEWRDSDGDISRDLRDLLMDRIRGREDLRDLIGDLLEQRQERRSELRERMQRWGDREDADEDGWRGRLRERVSQWREGQDEHEGGGRGRLHVRGLERGECYFLTRSLRDEDRDFFVLVRRRVCPD